MCIFYPPLVSGKNVALKLQGALPVYHAAPLLPKTIFSCRDPLKRSDHRLCHGDHRVLCFPVLRIFYPRAVRLKSVRKHIGSHISMKPKPIPLILYNLYCIKLPLCTNPKSVYSFTPISDAVICTVPQPYSFASCTTRESSSLAMPFLR